MPSGDTESAPSEKNALPSASSFPSSSTSSPSSGLPSSGIGGVTSPSRTRRRQLMAYCLPSSVREYRHQFPLRTGTDRSVSWVRALISSNTAERRSPSPDVSASV